jgi:mycothiol system anti-sigma-R factor
MKTCQEVLENLYVYLDKEMGQLEVTAIKEHLTICRPCFGKAEFETLLRKHMQEKTHQKCPDAVKARIKALLELY